MTQLIIDSINNIFSKLTYKFANTFNFCKMRNKTNGIELVDILLFKFGYTQINVTKQEIISNINHKNKTKFHRYSFHKKEQHLSKHFYFYLFNEISNIYNKYVSKTDDPVIIAVDGSSSNNITNDVCLNMCYYNINQFIPIDITFDGAENRNKEIKQFTENI